MTKKELIEALSSIKEAIANADELTDEARFKAYISVEDAIDHVRENYGGDD